MTNSTDQSPSWESNSRPASQEFPCLLRNPEVYYRVYKIPPLIHILNQMNPIHTFSPYVCKVHARQMRIKFGTTELITTIITIIIILLIQM
jgi:hypothetical protein